MTTFQTKLSWHASGICPYDRRRPERSSLLPSVRQATIDLLRTHGLTTWFSNPGSSELTRPTLINIRTTAVGAYPR
jgi:hypothetical protein